MSPRLGEGADSDGLPVSDWCLKGPNLRVSCQVKTPPFWPAADISLDQPRRLVCLARSICLDGSRLCASVAGYDEVRLPPANI